MNLENRLCVDLLSGARGDLHIDFDGGVRHVGHSTLQEMVEKIREHRAIHSKPLIWFVNDERRMTLTSAGAQFMLENLNGGRTPAEAKFLRERAESGRFDR